jgi:Zn-dependent M32 family carboxypeptidase
VHRLGMLYRPADLIEHATGKPPSVDDYVSYLTRKYSALYRLS